jgi:two-component system OmpR family response regulator
MYKILVVDDEFGILEVVQAYLLKEGYEVYTAMNGKQGLLLYEQAAPDLVVLDLMLPDISGEAICEAIRKTSNIPVIMLTAKKEEADRIQGLELGADDYLVKPFSPRELVIRIQGILRRVYGNNKVTKNIKSFNHNDLTINLQERQVTKLGKVVELTKNEYDLLLTFVENPNRTFTREQLIESTFGNDYMAYDRTVDVHIKNLRQKIESDPKVPSYVVTVYGVGYKFKGELD